MLLKNTILSFFTCINLLSIGFAGELVDVYRVPQKHSTDPQIVDFEIRLQKDKSEKIVGVNVTFVIPDTLTTSTLTRIKNNYDVDGLVDGRDMIDMFWNVKDNKENKNALRFLTIDSKGIIARQLSSESTASSRGAEHVALLSLVVPDSQFQLKPNQKEIDSIHSLVVPFGVEGGDEGLIAYHFAKGFIQFLSKGKGFVMLELTNESFEFEPGRSLFSSDERSDNLLSR